LTVLFYLIASYIPAFILTLMLGLCKKSADKPLPASGFVFNQQDMNDIQSILKIVRDLQAGQT